MKLFGSAIVTSPTGKGIIVIGGVTEYYESSKAIFEFSNSMQWTRLEQTLNIDHRIPLAIPITNELVYEKTKEKNIFDLPHLAFPMPNELVSIPYLQQTLVTSLYVLMGGIFLALLMWCFL